MTLTFSNANVKAALKAIESEVATTSEKIEMLIEMATRLQSQARTVEQIQNSIFLYRKGLELNTHDTLLLKARCLSGIGTALRSIPDNGENLLLESRSSYQEALPILEKYASPPEIAETQMNLGIVLQSLVAFNKATIQEAIQIYYKATKIFTGENYPQEFAILQNNIAIAYLSLPLGPDKEKIRYGVAVQSFQSALKWITITNYPSEYAMLQNNLANTLQYLPTSHPIENNLKALKAYDEALKVRTANDTPLEYANTIANKANVLFNLPDNIEHSKVRNFNNLKRCQKYCQEAYAIFTDHKQLEQAHIMNNMLQNVQKELLASS
ncbi:MAG: hypothetical protein JXR06_01990 [Candidatus Atelocyanobacterium thalassa]|uniref:Tetratricopeptide repeat protein n=1 Tax=Candidatus Atelocyanobacterium thalassa isolate SIO64986 TaxID=1527444 RepID=A0A086CIN0_9CHRO|nr:MAG: hypothetical protein ucyna2_00103 [Candidatus Atelocyanobacterium thalassa isolate SIO64986]